MARFVSDGRSRALGFVCPMALEATSEEQLVTRCGTPEVFPPACVGALALGRATLQPPRAVGARSEASAATAMCRPGSLASHVGALGSEPVRWLWRNRACSGHVSRRSSGAEGGRIGSVPARCGRDSGAMRNLLGVEHAFLVRRASSTPSAYAAYCLGGGARAGIQPPNVLGFFHGLRTQLHVDGIA